MEKVTLRTARLVLAPPTLADVDAITAACQDLELQRRVSSIPVPYSRGDAEGYVTGYSAAGWASGTSCTWAIHLDGAFAGAIGLDDIAGGRAEIGYWAAPEFRRRGVLTEAARAVVRFGIDPAPDGLGLQRIEWHAFAGNLGSAGVARNAGFRFEGTLRLGTMGRQGREDDWVAGILATDPHTQTPWPILGPILGPIL
ncbi:MAG: GNAT family N-acetyltransferase [Burkholderiaceae bacterium]|nr:GNAT family N-acetyltransferase [Microbacteriaceae bacterium]